jgi:hypothetical protein
VFTSSEQSEKNATGVWIDAPVAKAVFEAFKGTSFVDARTV